ncbi:hypothetical protein [Flavobacterium beibuense]|uniref:hypothetical protein n=1 Tax=Flavobacterium beibuense TaxID=657326 RepID=UPI003A93BC43
MDRNKVVVNGDLFLLSDEKINENDIIYSTLSKRVFKCGKTLVKKGIHFKVIATDSLLLISAGIIPPMNPL